MENRKGSGIFLGVIGVATLIVAIIGATFAFFGANASSAEDAVTIKSTTLKLGYSDVLTGLKTDLIPATAKIAQYAAMEQPTEETAADGYTGNYQCMDDNGNEVCGVYTFTVGNSSVTTTQNLYGSVKVTSNEFKNLYFRIYDEEGNPVTDATILPTEAGATVSLDGLNQTLLPSSDDAGRTEADGFKEDDPTTYTKVTNDAGLTNVRTYTMVLWIEETNSNQTEDDSGKIFSAGINFTTANDTSGVTGVIVAAQSEAQD